MIREISDLLVDSMQTYGRANSKNNIFGNHMPLSSAKQNFKEKELMSEREIITRINRCI